MTTRESIITAATAVFRSRGLEAAKISDIAKLAGLGHGTFYLYYKTKYAVIGDIAAREVADLHAQLGATTNGDLGFDEQVARIVRVYFDFVKTNREMYALIFVGLAQTDSLSSWEQLYVPVYQFFEEMLRRFKERGVIKKNFNIKYMAKFISGLIEFSAEQDHLYASVTEEETRGNQRELVAFIKKAVA